MAIMVQSYAFFLLFFHWLGLVCPPEQLSLNKAGEPKAHPKHLVEVLVFSLNLRPRGVLVGSEILSGYHKHQTLYGPFHKLDELH